MTVALVFGGHVPSGLTVFGKNIQIVALSMCEGGEQAPRGECGDVFEATDDVASGQVGLGSPRGSTPVRFACDGSRSA